MQVVSLLPNRVVRGGVIAATVDPCVVFVYPAMLFAPEVLPDQLAKGRRAPDLPNPLGLTSRTRNKSSSMGAWMARMALHSITVYRIGIMTIRWK